MNEREETKMTDPTFTDSRGIVLLDEGDPRATTCDICHHSWDDSVATAWTPTPAGRCPWEHEHPPVSDDPWADKTAYDLWNAFVDATADSDASWDFLQEMAVAAGFLVACPTCFHTVSPGEPVGPCEACDYDDRED
jgi:hypothetical protein